MKCDGIAQVGTSGVGGYSGDGAVLWRDGLDLFSQFNISCTHCLCAIYPPIDFVFVYNILLDRDLC